MTVQVTINLRPFDLKAHGAAEKLIERLTNWERSRWGRAGYPRDAETIARMFPQTVRRITGYVTTLSEPWRTS